jgi:hypothetical protein
MTETVMIMVVLVTTIREMMVGMTTIYDNEDEVMVMWP